MNLIMILIDLAVIRDAQMKRRSKTLIQILKRNSLELVLIHLDNFRMR